MDPHRVAELRSLAYHRAIAARIPKEPSIVRDVVSRLEGAKSPYARRWYTLLTGPQDKLLATLLADNEEARELRQSSPFAGVLDARERWAIWRREEKR